MQSCAGVVVLVVGGLISSCSYGIYWDKPPWPANTRAPGHNLYLEWHWSHYYQLSRKVQSLDIFGPILCLIKQILSFCQEKTDCIIAWVRVITMTTTTTVAGQQHRSLDARDAGASYRLGRDVTSINLYKFNLNFAVWLVLYMMRVVVVVSFAVSWNKCTLWLLKLFKFFIHFLHFL